MSASVGNRTECKKFVDININKPENDLVTPHHTSKIGGPYCFSPPCLVVEYVLCMHHAGS